MQVNALQREMMMMWWKVYGIELSWRSEKSYWELVCAIEIDLGNRLYRSLLKAFPFKDIPHYRTISLAFLVIIEYSLIWLNLCSSPLSGFTFVHKRLLLEAIDVGDSLLSTSILLTCLAGPGEMLSLACCSQKPTLFDLSNTLTPRCLLAN